MNKLSLSLATYLLILGLLSSCITKIGAVSQHQITADDLLLSEKADLTLKTNLLPPEVNRDLDILIYALQTGYGGRKYVDQNTFQSVITKLQALKLNAGVLTSTELFCNEIDKVLLELPDNHLHARTRQLGLSKLRTDSERKATVGLNVLAVKNKNWSIETRNLGKIKIGIIAITSFPDHHDEAWIGFKDSLDSILPSISALIIDLRGNGGGSDVMGRWLASRLIGKSVNSPYESVIKSRTPTTFALSINNRILKYIGLSEKNKPIPQYLTESITEYKDLYKKANKGEIPPEEIMPILYDIEVNPLPFAKPIYVLVDSECASSCESTVEFFENQANVRTVGENTAGSVHFGNVAHVVLPNSHIIVQIATDFWKYKDGRYIEKIGYRPKLSVAPGKNAMDAALAEIQK
jgi:hypothetical protein